MNQLKGTLLAGLACVSLATVHAQQVSSEDRQFIEKAATGGMHEVHMGKMGAERASSPAVKKYAQRLVNDHTKANQELMALAKRKGITLPADGQSGAHMSGHGATSGSSGNSSSEATSGSSSSSSERNSASHSGSQTSTGAGRQASSPESDSRSASSNRSGSSSGSSSAGSSSDASSFPGSDMLMGKSGTEFDTEFARMAVEDHQKDIAEFEKAASSASDSDVKAWAAKTLPTLRAHLKEAESLRKQ
jgi:putative membrane protein